MPIINDRDEVVVDLNDPRAHWAMTTLAHDYKNYDPEFSKELLSRLRDLTARDPEELSKE